MLKVAVKILSYFLIYLFLFIVTKPVFMALHLDLMGETGMFDWWDVIYHGIPMDCSVAGYFTVIPAISVVCETLFRTKLTETIIKAYTLISAFIISAVTVLDFVLYGYWNFRLDATPLFYFSSSPASAMASASAWQIVAAISIVCVLTAAIYLLLRHTAGSVAIRRVRFWPSTILAVVLTAALIIPIRGSLSVSTMNLSRSYYSANQRLNHAALNPIFTLLYSLTHQGNFESQFQFFDRQQAADITKNVLPGLCASSPADTLLTNKRPDIYIIILESFSTHLMPSLGGENIASGLDSIGRQGLMFTNFFASGARTDRAIPAILGAFPAQPTTSLMKFTKKIENAPSLAAILKNKAGYRTSYYYGGDANFTNMLAYLVSSGFDNIVSDKDFPISRRTGKWGAHDDALFSRVAEDLESATDSCAAFKVIQTSSSHEPFEVPYHNPHFANDMRKNAFAFADSCVTSFIDKLYHSGRWSNSLIFITADHYGVYPRHLDSTIDRHHIPLIITGGALTSEATVIDTYGDQTAIASTLLNMLGLGSESNSFAFSRNLFDPTTPQFAFFSEPGLAGYIDADKAAVLNLDNNAAIVESRGSQSAEAVRRAKAILQTVYTHLSEL